MLCLALLPLTGLAARPAKVLSAVVREIPSTTGRDQILGVSVTTEISPRSYDSVDAEVKKLSDAAVSAEFFMPLESNVVDLGLDSAPVKLFIQLR